MKQNEISRLARTDYAIKLQINKRRHGKSEPKDDLHDNLSRKRFHRHQCPKRHLNLGNAIEWPTGYRTVASWTISQKSHALQQSLLKPVTGKNLSRRAFQKAASIIVTAMREAKEVQYSRRLKICVKPD